MQSHQQEVFEQMEQMGFEKHIIDVAWNKSDIKTVEGLINWIENNPDPTPSEIQQISLNTPILDHSISTEVPKQNKNVANLVKKEYVLELMEKHNCSQLVAEKAVLMSGNSTLEKALTWIEEHKNDVDFQEPIEVEQRPELSPEEARMEAIKLQKQIREKALEIEKQRELESEKNRLQSGKELAEARRKQKSVEKRLAIEAQLKEKQKLDKEQNEMKRILEEDKKQRFGENYKPHEKVVVGTKDELEQLYEKMYKIYRMGQIEILRTCLKTLTLYTKNIIENPNNEKFGKINGNNQNFQTRVGDVIGGPEILTKIGFELQKDGFWHFKGTNVSEQKMIYEILQSKVQKLDEILQFIYVNLS